MSFKKNAGTLAKMITLLGAAYLPQAHANLDPTYSYDLGNIPVPTPDLVPVDISDSNLAVGASFIDQWQFEISSNAVLNSTAISYSLTVVENGPNEAGTDLSSISLNSFDGNTVLQQGTISPPSSEVDNGDGTYSYTYTGSIASTALSNPPGQYSIVIEGNVGQYAGLGAYTGSFALATPEPEEWAMFFLGLPLIGWVSRNKQNFLRNAALS